MRITVDTNILVSALGWNGAEAAIIEMVLESKLELCLSAEILSEFYRVAQYPKLGFTGEEIDGFIGRLLPVVIFVRPTQRVNAIMSDPDDNRIIECAMAGKAGYIVSGDQHLLRLEEYQGIKMMRAPEFLKLVFNAAE